MSGLKPGYNVIIGGQAGSESKGKLSAYLATARTPPDALVMAASPNAGHTMVLPDGTKKVSYHLPIACVVTDCPIFLGPSSLIHVQNFMAELHALDIDPSRVHIDPHAVCITAQALAMEEERSLTDIGSTMQGVGGARMAKMMRGADMAFVSQDPILQASGVNMEYNTSTLLARMLEQGGTVLCEMTQGFDLCLEHGIAPGRYVTSKLIVPAMALAEAGVPPHYLRNVYGVLRPYPIRVNNRTGTSGPYTGSEELTWQDVATACGYPGKVEQLAEITTTTKLLRRVFSFSWARFEHFVRVCAPTCLCLQFANYIDWSNYGATKEEDLSARTFAFIAELEATAGCAVQYVGTGPKHDEMIVRHLG